MLSSARARQPADGEVERRGLRAERTPASAFKARAPSQRNKVYLDGEASQRRPHDSRPEMSLRNQTLSVDTSTAAWKPDPAKPCSGPVTRGLESRIAPELRAALARAGGRLRILLAAACIAPA